MFGSTHLTRIAPTPSGLLHIGNAFSFVLTWLIARQQQAKILLRIDDLDSARKRPEYVEDVFRSLEWLGIDYDHGPAGVDDFEQNWSQSLRMELYSEALARLRNAGAVFGCACTRRSIRQQSSNGTHPQACRDAWQSADEAGVAWRVSTAGTSSLASTIEWRDRDEQAHRIDLDAAMRDFVVRRRDGIPAYQVASLVDDLHYGVTTIVRGIDLVESTAAQIWLSQWLEEPTFEQSQFLHHELMQDASGEKLSKSLGASSLREMRNNKSSDELFRQISPLLGFSEPVNSAREALDAWNRKPGQG